MEAHLRREKHTLKKEMRRMEEERNRMRQHLHRLEGAVAVGRLSALGAGLYSIGIPKDSVLQYETSLKSDKYLVIAHGTADEAARAKEILALLNIAEVVVHHG
jgi:hypothetical protein